MLILFILACLANIAFAFGLSPCKPGCEICVAEAVMLSFFVSIVLVLFLAVTSKWVLSKRSGWWGTPNRDYWTSEQNLPESIRRVRFTMYMVGATVMLCILFNQWDTFRMSRVFAPEVVLCPRFFLSPYRYFAFGILTIVFVGGAIHLHLSFFRIPKDSSEAEPPTH